MPACVRMGSIQSTTLALSLIHTRMTRWSHWPEA